MINYKLIEIYKRQNIRLSWSLVRYQFVLLFVFPVTSLHFTCLLTEMKWNRSHNDRSPRLCVSPRRRPHVTAVCPTVVCKFLYYYILLIILSSIFISILLNIIPDSLVTLHQGLLRTFVQEFLWKILFLYYKTNIICFLD